MRYYVGRSLEKQVILDGFFGKGWIARKKAGKLAERFRRTLKLFFEHC